MSLTVKHLNNDASFLLTFSPSVTSKSLTPTTPITPTSTASKDFTVLLDPWLSGTSKIWMKSFSQSTHRVPSCISTLASLPIPDLIVISQNKTDHCHEETLKQLPASGTKTLILAEPGAARTIRSWKYFDADKVITLPRWEDPRSKTDVTFRLPIPPTNETDLPGEVTVAWIPQKYDINGLHSAIGITYRAPTPPSFLANLPLTPPASPLSPASPTFSTISKTSKSSKTLRRGPPPPPALSCIYSPHGINARSITPYASHLAAESALPLTSLLHCFDRVQNPWWFGGNICSGADSGMDIAKMLGARTWVSAHDGDKLTTGWASSLLKIDKGDMGVIEEAVSPRREGFDDVQGEGTKVGILGVGEEWRVDLNGGGECGDGHGQVGGWFYS